MKNFFQHPDSQGYFGQFGGRFVAESLIYPLEELSKAYNHYKKDPDFIAEVGDLLSSYVGRPTPLYHAKKWSEKIGGAQIYFKREDLNHTGAHKVNNTVGQILLAKKMGKTRIIAETGAGQHGVASATVSALLDIPCVVYMGEKDVARQAINVYRMQLLGAEVVPVKSGTKTLKDALNEALRDWVTNVDDTFYAIGTVAGPHPYPEMVRDFQKIIGEETREQSKKQLGKLPDALIACVGGGSNAMGLFYPFLNDEEVKIYGVEAGGLGIAKNAHAAPLCAGKPGILHGNKTYLMMDDDGQIMDTQSVSAGLDYPGVGPEHSYLKDESRVEYTYTTDDEVLEAFYEVTRTEGIIPALETSHALAYAKKLSKNLDKGKNIVVCLSGRGDKDIDSVRAIEKQT
jgi:tryptophan synthase beta chain